MRRKWLFASILAIVLMLLTACGQFHSKEDNGQNASPDPVSEPPQEEVQTYAVELYFADADLMHLYKVEREVQAEEEDELPLETLKLWIQGPEQEELAGLIPTDVEVKDLKIAEGLATVNFSEEILKANVGSTGELFILDSLALILKQFDADQVQILVNGETVETLYGHIKVEEPYSYEDDRNYDIKIFQ